MHCAGTKCDEELTIVRYIYRKKYFRFVIRPNLLRMLAVGPSIKLNAELVQLCVDHEQNQFEMRSLVMRYRPFL